MKKIIFLTFLLLSSTEVYSKCDTKEKLEEKQKNEALKMLGYAGAVLNEKTGKYEEYNFETCEYEEVE